MSIIDFFKSLNPKDGEKDILIYGRHYKLWRRGKYLGIGIWTQDDNVGDSFQMEVFNTELKKNISQVFVADSWELIITSPRDLNRKSFIVIDDIGIDIKPYTLLPFWFTFNMRASLEIQAKIQHQKILLANKMGESETEKYLETIKVEAYAQVTPNSEYILNKLVAKRQELELKTD